MTQTHAGMAVARSGPLFHRDADDSVPMFTGTHVPVQALFRRLADGYALDAFVAEFPAVSRDQAVRAVHVGRALLEVFAYGDAATLDRLSNGDGASRAGIGVIRRDSDIVGGTPVFEGSRMIVRNLFDYLAAGDTISSFLASFDTSVTPEQAAAAIDIAAEAIETYPYATAPR